ncbi:hypothetical protein D3C84_704250 [compost metagenome]
MRDLRGDTGVAQGTGIANPALGVAVSARFVIQCPHQRGEFSAALARQFFERSFWESVAGHRRNGGNAVMDQGNRIEDAFYNP